MNDFFANDPSPVTYEELAQVEDEFEEIDSQLGMHSNH